jgi:tyrosyl-tRNA synthetase
MTFSEVMELAAKFTVARMLERDDFAKRFSAQQPISIHEFFYPLMQGYDSVMIKADVEIGATEQKFNLIIGRQIQQEYGQEPQVVLTLPVLPGIDGVQRMSKSIGNYIGIDEAPEEMYGKVMRIPDELIYTYFELVTDVSNDKLREIKIQLETQSVNPRDLKHDLAFTIVRMYHNEEKARAARHHFETLFIKKDIPDDMPEVQTTVGTKLVDLVLEQNLFSSKSEVRRLIKQGGVSIDKEKIQDEFFTFENKGEFVVKLGKRKFLRILVN